MKKEWGLLPEKLPWVHYQIDPQGNLKKIARQDRATFENILTVEENSAILLPDFCNYELLFYDENNHMIHKLKLYGNSGYAAYLPGGSRFRIYAASQEAIDLQRLKAVQIVLCKGCSLEEILRWDDIRQIKMIGDSITAGSGGSRCAETGICFVSPSNKKMARRENLYGFCWANLLKARLEKERGIHAKNWGCTKYSSMNLLAALPELIEPKDDLILCMTGTNDRLSTLENFRERLLSLFAYCMCVGKKLVLMSPILSTLEESQPDLSFTLHEVRNTMKRTCRDIGIPFLDMQTAFNKQLAACSVPLEKALADGLHPNDLGYYLMYRAACTLLGIPAISAGALEIPPLKGGRTKRENTPESTAEKTASKKAIPSSPLLDVSAGQYLYFPPKSLKSIMLCDQIGNIIRQKEIASDAFRVKFYYPATVCLSFNRTPVFAPYLEDELLPIAPASEKKPGAWDYYNQAAVQLLQDGELKTTWSYSNRLQPSLPSYPQENAAMSAERMTALAVQGTIVLPTQQILKAGQGMWDQSFEAVVRSSRLWQFSLFWINVMLDCHERNPDMEILRAVEAQLESFLDWLDGDFAKLGYQYIPSAEHACAVRCVTFCNALRAFPPDWRLRAPVLTMLYQHCDWLSNPPFQIRNNHGFIMLEGIMQGVAILQDHPRNESCWKNQLMDWVEAEANAIFSYNFDKDGFARENTIGYHRFNIHCLENLISVKNENCLPLNMREIEEALPKLHSIMRQMIWQNGMIPPHGDADAIQSGETSINQDHYYQEGNWLILKNDRRYASFRCGFTRPAHKHVDEGCVTLRYQNRDILVDCGCYNYDREDPIRQYVESARGHSGCYPVSLYPFLSPQYCREIHKSSAITNVSQHNGVTTARSFLDLQNGFHTERKIEEQEGSLIIQDSFSCSQAEDVEIRFCLHPNTKIVQWNGKRTVLCKNVDIWFLIEFPQPNPNYPCELVEESGFYSEKTNRAARAPVFVLRFPAARRGTAETRIYYGSCLLLWTESSYPYSGQIRFLKKEASLSIYGSCVSRDVLEYDKGKNIALREYIGRQSIFSALSPAIPPGKIELHNPSPFRQRAVERDLSKTAFSLLADSASAYLILDLIDERFNLLTLDNTLVTASNEFFESVDKEYRKAPVRKLNLKGGKLYLGDECVEEQLKRFCSMILAIYPPSRIILHRAKMLDQYVAKNGQIKKFYAAQLAFNREFNAIIDTMFQRMLEYFPGAHMIDEMDGIFAFEDNKWGLAPMHYQVEYYQRVWKRLYQIILEGKT